MRQGLACVSLALTAEPAAALSGLFNTTTASRLALLGDACNSQAQAVGSGGRFSSRSDAGFAKAFARREPICRQLRGVVIGLVGRFASGLFGLLRLLGELSLPLFVLIIRFGQVVCPL